MKIKENKIIVFILILSFLMLSGCLAAELAVEGGAEIGEFSIINSAIDAAGGLEAVGVTFDASTSLLRITEEEKFISALQKVKVELPIKVNEAPKLYFQENNIKNYFGELVSDEITNDKAINITAGNGESKIIRIPKGWNLYKVAGDNIDIKIYDSYGNASIYRPYKLRTNSIVFVVRKIGELSEIQLNSGLTGFVNSALLTEILINKHLKLNMTVTQNNPPSNSQAYTPPTIDYTKGGYCLRNVGTRTMSVDIRKAGSQNWDIIRTITIDPNETGCFMGLDVANYTISYKANSITGFGEAPAKQKEIHITGGINNPPSDNISL